MTEALAAPGRLERRKARTRAAIIDAATALFHERGFEETSIQQIAERADTGVGTLYGYFGSKDQILREVLHFARDEALERYMAAIDETTPWIDRLCTALGVLVDYFRENRTMLTAAFHVATREAPQIDGREAVWLYNAYLSLLEDGIAAGEFRQVPADATVRLLINAYTTAALGIGTWAGRGDDPKLMAELDELVRGLVLKR
jgi:AcrR family transcriptional regulator